MQSRKSKWVAAAFALVCATLVPNLHQPQAQVRVGTLALNFGLSLMRLIHSDGQLRATAENIMASCIEKARLTPVNGSFWSEADTVAKPAILHLAFHSDSDTKNLCNRLLTQTLKGQPEIAKGLNGAVKAIQQLYGPVQGSVRADPVFRQINGDFLAAMKTSDIAHHWNAPGLAKMEAALVETSGRQMTRDETLVTLGMARRNLFGRAKASASLLSLPALRKSGDIHADDTAKADELVAALWDAKSPTSIRLQSPLRVSAPDGSHTQTSPRFATPG